MKIRHTEAVTTSSTAASPASTATKTLAARSAPHSRPGHSGIDAFVVSAEAKKRTVTGTGGTSSQNDLTYQGGAVLKNPVFQPIYLGDYWKTAKGAADRAYNDGFAQEIGTSKHQAILAQYGVGEGSAAPSTVVPGAPAKVTKNDIIALVKQQLASGAVQAGKETVHMVVLPPGTVLDAGRGVTSKNGLGGFHGSYVDDQGKNVYFGAIAYSQGNNGIDFTGKARDNITITESHEFDEAATDPDVNNGKLGWYNDKYGEIGDLAVNSGLVPLNKAFVRDDKGYAEQVEWSNQDHAFVG